MWNIAQRRTERTWEFVLPPGAPGSGNDEEDLLFTERRLSVSCLAWRPDGEFSPPSS
jgi:syntaxin-binding protein 5